MAPMIDVDPPVLMWATLGLGALAIIGFANRRIPLEATSAALLGLLLVLFAIAPLPVGIDGRMLDATELLRGFVGRSAAAMTATIVFIQAAGW